MERSLNGARSRWAGLKALAAFAAAAICAAFAPLAAGAEENPAAVVEGFQAVLVSVMKDAGKLGYAGRYRRLAPAVEQSHDLQSIAAFAAGRYWQQLSDAQKSLLVATFSEWSISTYAHQFDAYSGSGESFKTLSVEQTPRGEALVRSALVKPGGETIRFDYLLRRRDGGWRIVNIVVDGVSDLAIRRSEFAGILRTEGFDALIKKLKDKIAAQSKSAGS
jgi:phospholipid transport system substrate-binding protein